MSYGGAWKRELCSKCYRTILISCILYFMFLISVYDELPKDIDNTEPSRHISEHNYDTEPHIYATPKVAVVIYSRFRTGSSFTTDFLKRQRNMFVSYEPLFLVHAKPTTEENLQNASRYIDDILHCKFRYLATFLKDIIPEKKTF